MKKRILSAILALTTAAALAACATTTPPAGNSPAEEAAEESAEAAEETAEGAEAGETAAAEDELAAIQAAVVITVGIEGTYPPYCYHDESGALVGFEVETAQAIAEKLGVKAEFVEADWDSLIAGMQAGRFNVMLNDVTPTEERKESFDFTEPYTYVHDVLIVESGNEDIKTFEDLKGRNTSNTISSTFAQIAESYGAKVTPIDTFEQSVEMVASGRAEATINSELVFADYMKNNPDAPLKVVASTEEVAVTAIPVSKGQQNLVDALNKAIDELREDGTLGELSVKYFDVDVTVQPE